LDVKTNEMPNHITGYNTHQYIVMILTRRDKSYSSMDFL